MARHDDFDELVKLKSIDLESRGLRDEDLGVLIRVLRESTVVELLDLSDNHITLADGTFAEALAKNKTLRVLFLGGNEINADGARQLAKALKENATIEEINLSYNHFGDDAAKFIADALMSNQSLKQLDLYKNDITDDGASAFATCLLVNKSLKVLELRQIRITDNGIAKIGSALKCNHGLEQIYYTRWLIIDPLSKKIGDMLGKTNRKRKPLSQEQVDAIVALKNEVNGRIVKGQESQIAALKTEVEGKNEEIAAKDIAFAAKETEIEDKNVEIAEKDAQIVSLRGQLQNPKRLLELYMNKTEEKIARQGAKITALEADVNSSIPFSNTVDLTLEATEEPNNKRPRLEDVVRSSYAVQHEQELNQKIVQIKQEKGTAETELENMKEEKQAVEREKNAALLKLECNICLDVKDENYALVPCGHVLCSDCKENYVSCPTCSSNIGSHLRLYGR